MKLPRLQYTYVVFYTLYGNSPGRLVIETINRINSLKRIVESEELISCSHEIEYSSVIITNYKLLSVRIVWR